MSTNTLEGLPCMVHLLKKPQLVEEQIAARKFLRTRQKKRETPQARQRRLL